MTAQELKNSILQFAVQGKLVPQNPHDEPASELIKKIKAEKEKLILERKVKKIRPLLPITDEEKPFEIPESWEWARLYDVSIIQEGAGIRSFQYKTSGTQILTVTNILEGSVDLEKSKKYVSIEEYQTKYSHLKVDIGDIVSSCSGASWGKTAIFNEPDTVMLNTSTLRLRFYNDSANNKYLYYITKSPSFKQQLQNQLSGMQPNFGFAHYSTVIIPLPPLAEQQRIVDKIEELMPLVEQYGSAELELRQLNTKFPEQLKKSVLQYAVQGKLIPQNPQDESATVLLEKIKAEKKQLIKDKKIKQDKPLPEIKEEEIPFEIPDSWVWVRLGEIAEVCTGATPLTTNQEYYSSGNIPWITSGATGNLFVDKVETFITEKAIKETNCKVYPIGTLIVAMYGQGKTRGQITELNTEAATNQACAAINLHINDLYLRRYIKQLFQKIYAEIRELAYGGAQPNLNLSTIKETLIPLPPLSEQKLIVEKVEEVLSYCDKLK